MKSKTRGVFLYLPFIVERPKMAGKTPEVTGVGCAYTRLEFVLQPPKNTKYAHLKLIPARFKDEIEIIRGLPNQEKNRNSPEFLSGFYWGRGNERERE
ncbi:hypothetical protein EV2_032409 [Malus domestica]